MSNKPVAYAHRKGRTVVTNYDNVPFNAYRLARDANSNMATDVWSWIRFRTPVTNDGCSRYERLAIWLTLLIPAWAIIASFAVSKSLAITVQVGVPVAIAIGFILSVSVFFKLKDLKRRENALYTSRITAARGIGKELRLNPDDVTLELVKDLAKKYPTYLVLEEAKQAAELVKRQKEEQARKHRSQSKRGTSRNDYVPQRSRRSDSYENTQPDMMQVDRHGLAVLPGASINIAGDPFTG